jgi:2-keto-3-deoxy-L-rhamnonate aldolase RhmA
VTVARLLWNRKRNLLKAKIEAGSPALAMWVTIPWPPLLEIIGAAGLDAAFIDLEHASFGPLVRPSAIDPAEVGRILDAGAQGIAFPRVTDANDADLARRCLRYAPEGVRGWGGAHTRYAMWQGTSAAMALHATTLEGKGVYSSEYVNKAADHLLSVFIIESRHGVQNLAEILDAGQPDLVTFGWGDYSVEVGFDLAACEEAASRVYDVCKSREIGVSIAVGQSGPTTFYPGCFGVVGIDALLVSSALDSAIASAAAAYHEHGLKLD